MVKLEVLAHGFGHLEAPRVDRRNRLYVSDYTVGGVMRRNPDGSIEQLFGNRTGIGGLAFNEDGGLIVTGPTLAVWDETGGALLDVYRPPIPAPLEFVRFNDLTIDAQGRVYTGTLNYIDLANRKLIPGQLIRVNAEGRVELLWQGIGASNGLGFSPDGRLLYHCDTLSAIFVYDVTPEGEVRDRREFARMPDGGFPDGLAVDVEGGVWVAGWGSGEIVRFRRDGVIDQRVPVQGRNVTSLVFAGDDLQELYVVTADNNDPALGATVFRGRTDIPGLGVAMGRLVPAPEP